MYVNFKASPFRKQCHGAVSSGKSARVAPSGIVSMRTRWSFLSKNSPMPKSWNYQELFFIGRCMWVKCEVSSGGSRPQSGIVDVLKVEEMVSLGRVDLELTL